MAPETQSNSDADFELARRAVDFGWLTRAQVEVALLEVDLLPDSRLLAHLPLTPDQIRKLESPAPTVPRELALAAADPSRHVAQYILTELHRTGGMGTVIKAWDMRLSRWVALKFMKNFHDARLRKCFEEEARLAAGLAHPNIAAIYEIGEYDGAPFIAMQFIEGRTLGEARPDLKPREAARIVRDASLAVAFAHEQGTIHRDLKPSNVMLDRSGRVYVMDFGLAMRTELSESHMRPKLVTGTPEYISPEQARGDREDARTDVHGLGATLYHLLTGRPPNPGSSDSEILRRISRDERLKPRALTWGIDADLEMIVLKCLEKSPNRRYSSAKELAEDLDRYLNRDPVRACSPSLLYRLRMRLAKRKALVFTFVAALLLALPASLADMSTAAPIRTEYELQMQDIKAIQSRIDVLTRQVNNLWAKYQKTHDEAIREKIDSLLGRIRLLQGLQEEIRAN